MSKRKHGYTWPHRSRKAMISYLSEHESYWPMNSNNGGFVLAWNIKVYNFDITGHTSPDYSFRADRDAAWEKHCEDDAYLFGQVCEDATRYYTDKEWTNYPGIEQGEWGFGINGRSGGYLILSEAPDWLPHPRAFRCCAMSWDSRGHYHDWLAELDTPTLRRFYRAVRVLDHDLRREACNAEMSYHYAFARSVWEEELDAAESCDARKQERGRPDMYA